MSHAQLFENVLRNKTPISDLDDRLSAALTNTLVSTTTLI
jgi:hypothetical protein